MINKRASDVQLNQTSTDAPVKFDNFVEFTNVLVSLISKLDLITITQPINLDMVVDSGAVGTITNFKSEL
jgi:hypothetical protein